jgi:hypothetical protein
MNNFSTGQLDEFTDTASGDKKLLALLYDNFLVGCLDTTPQRFLFGLLDDDSGDLQGVYSSSAADSSGVADDSGVFLVKTNPDAAAGQHSVCVFFRKSRGQYDKKCAQDPDNKLRLYRTQEQTQLDLLSTVTVVQNYALPSSPEWRGVKVSNGLPRGVFVDKVEINFSADPILTIE